MSFLTRSALRSTRTPCLRLSASPATRPFHSSSARAVLSESDHDQDTGSRKAAIDGAKDQQLKEQKEGKGQWKSELSSNSEAALKADRGDIGKDDIAKMQKESAGKMEEDHSHGKK